MYKKFSIVTICDDNLDQETVDRLLAAWHKVAEQIICDCYIHGVESKCRFKLAKTAISKTDEKELESIIASSQDYKAPPL